MKKTLLIIPLISGFGLWYAGSVSLGWGRGASTNAQYLTEPVEKGEIRRVITATGELKAIVNVEVGSQLSGQIASLLVDFNDQVKKGQPLAQLDQKSFRSHANEAAAAVKVAEASIGEAKAKLERARVDVLDSEAQTAALSARTDRARVALEAAQSELRRKAALREWQVGSTVELEDSRTKTASMAAALREAEALAAAHEHTLEGAKADVHRMEAELEAAIASLAQKRALLQSAQIDLEQTIIRSPIDGVIVGRNVSEGQTLATTLEAKTLFTIAGDLRQMEIHAKVDEADIGKIRDGQEATFSVDAYPLRRFSATVRQVRKAPEVKQNVVTYTVVLAADNHEDILLPGMTALVRITVNKAGPVLMLPLAALRFAPKTHQHDVSRPSENPQERPAVIWIASDNGEPKPATVELGDDDDSHVAVLRGNLALGDQVIIGEAMKPSSRRLLGIRLGF